MDMYMFSSKPGLPSSLTEEMLNGPSVELTQRMPMVFCASSPKDDQCRCRLTLYATIPRQILESFDNKESSSGYTHDFNVWLASCRS